jgi:hypothetical protein
MYFSAYQIENKWFPPRFGLEHEKTRRAPGFPLSSLLLLFYQVEHNYYANYFGEGSGWWGVG